MTVQDGIAFGLGFGIAVGFLGACIWGLALAAGIIRLERVDDE